MLFQGPNHVIDFDQPVVVHATGAITWRQAKDMVSTYRPQLASLSQQRVGLPFHANVQGLALVTVLHELGCNIFLLPNDATQDQLEETVKRFKLSALVIAPPSLDSDPQVLSFGESETGNSTTAGITILTSGTTGTPKAARHTLESLAKPTRVHEDFTGTSWLLSYRPNLYAGLQVMLQCLVNGGKLVVPDGSATAEEIAQLAVKGGVQYASATPSYWRWLLTFAPKSVLSQIPFKQITLGGEIVDQPVLDRLSGIYPEARLVHIYATTELGRCFSVTDKQAGFPASYLQKPSPDGVALQVNDGELFVQSANAMINYDPLCGQQMQNTQWYATGDLVYQQEERYYFIGRRNDMINVGGNKVSPAKVEEVIMQLPEIEDVRVYARKSSIMGQLVACEIVVGADVDKDTLKKILKSHCSEFLTGYETPQLIRFVEMIQVSAAMKKVRTNE